MNAAHVSACERYRYTLERDVTPHTRELGDATPDHAGSVPLVWLMLNPSTADAVKDDPTIRKVRGFTARAGYPGFVVVNLFAIRATDPGLVRSTLLHDGNPLAAEGPENEATIRRVCAGALVVCAWGRPAWARPQAKRVLRWLDDGGARLVCIDTNGDGSPRHPLMQPYRKRLRPFWRS